MSGVPYTEEIKRDAIAQVTRRGNPVREVASKLDISTKSLYDLDILSKVLFFFGNETNHFGCAYVTLGLHSHYPKM